MEEDKANQNMDEIISKSWNRSIATANKIGFMDGASDGQEAVFQSSFDLGYKQGLNFGFELQQKKGMSLKVPVHNIEQDLTDPRKINCQVCLNISSVQQQNVGNIYNLQQEKNIEFLSRSTN